VRKLFRLIPALALVTLLGLWGGEPVQAQQTGTIGGSVVDANTLRPIPSVQISIQGLGIGALTRDDGRYLLVNVPAGTHTVQAQILGYTMATARVTVVAEQTATANFSLAQSAVALDEVVVIGYGTQQRREVTGAVASVRGAEIAQTPTVGIQSALQGRLAGVNVADASGEPGAAPQVTIRGVGSISAGNDPLYVIDGVPYTMNVEAQGRVGQQNPRFGESRANPLAALNPNDIETIEVLKDAAAAAIYGSRGSNGVILITTKRGRENMAPEVNFRAMGGVQHAFNRPSIMNAAQHIQYVKDSRNNAYLTARNPLNPASPFYNPQYDPNTNVGRVGAGGNELIPVGYVNWDGTDSDWIGAVLAPAALQNYDMSLRGGGQNFNYYVSGSYLNQSGVIEGSLFERYALRANLTLDPMARLRLNLDVNSAFGDHDRKQAHAPYFGRPPGIIYSAMVASPAVPIYDASGNYLQAGPGSINTIGNGMTTTNHPLAARDFIDDKLQNGRVFGNLSGNYSLLENLQFRSMFGFDYDTNRRHFYQGTQLIYRGGVNPEPYGQAFWSQSYNWLLENTLHHNRTIGRHRFDALAGYTAQRNFEERSHIIARNFPDDNVRTINAGELAGGDQFQAEWSLVSLLGRVNYTLMDRYLATLTVRSDRSSRFGWGNQTGIFPSASVGWLVTQEPFMRDVTVISQLKPRLSYGVTGNFQIPNYGSIGLVATTPYVLGGAIVPGAAPRTMGNRELTWETTEQVNAGVDVGILSDRIFGSFDYYVSDTRDLLLDVTVPSSTGFATVLTNIGRVENRGFEAQVTSRNLVGAFLWSTDLSYGSNRNTVKALGPSGDPILSEGAAGIRHITQIGSPIGSYFGYVHDGIYMTAADLANAPRDTQGRPSLGDIRFKDINGDGIIDSRDRTVIGSYHPDFTWGLTNRFGYRGFDMSVFFQGVVGREILNLTRRHLVSEGNFNQYGNLVGNYWRSPEEPGDGWNPRADRSQTGNNMRESDYLVEDGSYTALKTITLGYNVPSRFLGRIASSARINASVNNVFIWTDYWGWNPEATIQGSALTPGEDYGAYPLMRAFQLGIDFRL
jgi:TonB-linked SusC/RagA family outer membrane protein